MKLECSEEISIFLFPPHAEFLKKKKWRREKKKVAESPVDLNASEQSEHQDDSAAGGERPPRIEN